MRKYKTDHRHINVPPTIAFFIFALLSFSLFFTLSPHNAQANPVDAYFLADVKTGAVLESKNADIITYPASLTKMMTLYLLFEDLKQKKIKLSDNITVSKNAAQKSATNLNLKGGERLNVETAIKAIIVRSANDIATAVSERLSGSEPKFAQRMTKKARQLGMNRTRFFNASGLPDTRQVTTARDMAILGVALFRDFPGYYHYFSEDSFTYSGVTYTGHNRVTRNYEGADGIKTGYIRLSGFNLVTSAKRNNKRLIGVVLGGDSSFSRDQKMQAMLDRGFQGIAQPSNKDILIAKAASEANNPAISSDNDLETPTEIADNSTESAKIDVAANVDNSSVSGGTDEFDIVSQTIQRFQEEQASKEDGLSSPTTNLPVAKAPLAKTASKKIVAKNEKSAVKSAKKTTKQPIITASSSGNFGIQVGAYNKYQLAKNAALKAANTIKRKQSNVIIDQSKNNGPASLYRARVAGLSKKEAEQACRSLKAKGTSCFIVQGLDTIASQN